LGTTGRLDDIRYRQPFPVGLKGTTSNVQHPTSNIQLKSMILRLWLAGTIVTVAILAGLACGALSWGAEIPRGSKNDEAKIRAVLSAQVAAWNRGDIDGFMDGYARSGATEFISGDKLTRGWQTVRDRYKKKYDSREKMGTLTFSELKITRLSSDAALVIGRWRLVRKGDKPHGRFTLLLRRTPAGWRIGHDHTS
jgi:ketosteroid isomerase-like protein